MKQLWFTCFSIVFLNSCQQQETATQKAQDIPVDTEVPELSIFQLPSQWTTQDNQEIVLEELQGKVLVMAMIYTSCQFACPRLVADMQRIEKEVAVDKRSDINLVLISIDPEHDQPDTLKQFAIENDLDPARWTLLQGNQDNVLEFAAVLGVQYQKISPVDFSHSNIISVFDHQGVLKYQQEGHGQDNTRIIGEIEALVPRDN